MSPGGRQAVHSVPILVDDGRGSDNEFDVAALSNDPADGPTEGRFRPATHNVDAERAEYGFRCFELRGGIVISTDEDDTLQRGGVPNLSLETVV